MSKRSQDDSRGHISQENNNLCGNNSSNDQVLIDDYNQKSEFHQNLLSEVAKLDEEIKNSGQNLLLQQQLTLDDVEGAEVFNSKTFQNLHDQSLISSSPKYSRSQGSNDEKQASRKYDDDWNLRKNELIRTEKNDFHRSRSFTFDTEFQNWRFANQLHWNPFSSHQEFQSPKSEPFFSRSISRDQKREKRDLS